MTTEMVTDRLRHRPTPISVRTNRALTTHAPVDAPRLVAHDDALVELDDPLAHLVDHLVVVRRHDHGRARLVDAVEQLHDPDARGGVEVPGGLVGQQDRRPVDEGPCDGDALLLTAGQLVGQPVGLAVETDQLQHLGHRAVDDVLRLADHLQREGDVLAGATCSAAAGSPGTRRPADGGSAAPSTRRAGPRSRPATWTVPELACSSLRHSRRKLDLPEPEAPTRKTNSPRSMLSVTSSSAARCLAL